MTQSENWFLLIQYLREGRTDVAEFADADKAADAYNKAERQYRDQVIGPHASMDVLLVGAESLDVVKTRYPSYFLTETSRSAHIAKLLDLLRDMPAVGKTA